jgi:DnaJ like chaperone protein
MFERTDPKTLKLWLIVAAVVYLLLPYDLFPDFLGIPGRIDDVLMLAWLAWFYRNHVQQYAAAGSAPPSAGGSADTDSGQGGSAAGSKPSKAFDAYEVLGVARSASSDAIQAAYRARMKEYHPDKVAHLGEELQKLATEKSQQIQRAYRQLHG